MTTITDSCRTDSVLYKRRNQPTREQVKVLGPLLRPSDNY